MYVCVCTFFLRGWFVCILISLFASVLFFLRKKKKEFVFDACLWSACVWLCPLHLLSVCRVTTDVQMYTEETLTLYLCLWTIGVWSIPSGVWRGVGRRPYSVCLWLRVTQSQFCVLMLQMSCCSLDLKVHTPLNEILAQLFKCILSKYWFFLKKNTLKWKVWHPNIILFCEH